MAVYGYADVGRFGLGHSLLAWARCTVWCAQTGATMLGPIWLRPRIGPYLRRERDKREYFRLFTNAPYPSLLTRTRLLLTSNMLQANDFAGQMEPKDGDVVVFKNAHANNFGKYFHEILQHGPLLKAELTKMTRSAYRPDMIDVEPFVAIHVRLGDFQPYDAKAIAEGKHNHSLPIEWYCSALEALRAALGYNIPALVYSDGEDFELATLLSLPSVQRAKAGASITHLLEMTQASALIASGSGFSFWSAFLGEVPRMVFPGQALEEIKVDVPTVAWSQGQRSIEPEFVAMIEENALHGRTRA